jgi:glycosyltransferase involved in cell wall biosynthesis
MRVCLDLTPGIQGHAGIGRYAEELARALLDACKDVDVRLFYTDPLRRVPLPPLDTLPRRTLPLSNRPWRLSVLLGNWLHVSMDRVVGEADVFHATDHLLPPLRATRSVFTVYDLTVFEQPATHSCLNRWFTRLMLPRFLRAADAVIAVSRSTQDDLARHYPFVMGKTVVIHPGVTPHFRPAGRDTLERVRREYALPARFFLHVGTIEPRKNLITLFEAFKRAELDNVGLVIAGKRGWLSETTLARMHQLGLERSVRLVGRVPDHDLPALYTLAEAFVFPSLYEGFGFPVIEAMACGTPVLCSDTSSLPEVVGDAALLLPAQDVRQWAEALVMIAHDASLRADLSRRGQRQAARFTWQESACRTCEVYREVYAHRD